MSVPNKRIAKHKTRQRRSHHALTKLQLMTCPKCQKPKRSHIACAFCGSYGERVGFTPRTAKKKTSKKETKTEKK